jgi:histidinol dehydrogenase
VQTLDWTAATPDARRAALARPAAERREDVFRQAGEIVAAVRAEGDAAVRRFTQKFGGPALDDLRVSAAEFRAARAALRNDEMAALERAVANVSRFHEAQLSGALSVETMPGVRCERITRPIDSVGLYVPAGTAPLPSTAIMLAVPARIAGCASRAVASSPGADGKVHAAVLVAAELCGVDTVYKMGGIRPQGRQDPRTRQRVGHRRQADRRGRPRGRGHRSARGTF